MKPISKDLKCYFDIYISKYDTDIDNVLLNGKQTNTDTENNMENGLYMYRN